MTISPAHLSLKLVADLSEGLLDADESSRATAHLDGCAQCSALADELAATRQLLVADGADPPPMPSAVAGRLDATFAAQRHRSRLPQLLVAATSVAVLGVAIGIGASNLGDQGTAVDALGSSADRDTAGSVQGGDSSKPDRQPTEAAERAAPDAQEYSASLRGLRSAILRHQLARRLTAKVTKDQLAASDPLDDATLACVRSALGRAPAPNWMIYRAELDGRPIHLVVVPSAPGARRALAVDCTGRPEVVARTKVPTR